MLRVNEARRLSPLATVLGLISTGLAFTVAHAAEAEGSARAVLWQPSMNVFRRHAVESEAMFEFYGGVLGFEQLQTLNPSGGAGVARFKVGDSELKFTRRVARRDYVSGGVPDATGVRLLSFFFSDLDVLLARFEAHGLARPAFATVPGTHRRSALMQDPDGQWVELVIVDAADPAPRTGIEVGLTVSDLEQSVAFYRDFVGLEELEPVQDPWFGGRKYPFRHGSTIVSLRSFDRDLPADTGSGGIQYVVSDVDLVDTLAKARGVTIDQPLRDMRASLRTIWLDDPDGITNYFAETRASRSEPAP